MTYRLIAVDMDGTLLDNDKNISPRTEAAVRKAGECGVCVCLSTGRPLCGVRRYLEQLALDTPVITCNGAVIADAVTGRSLFRRCLVPDAAQAVWERGLSFAVTMCVWVGERLFVSELNERTQEYKKLSGVEPEPVTDFRSLAEEGISKILWSDTAENIARLRGELSDISRRGVSFVTSNPQFLEFYDSCVSKAKAMEFLGEYLGITREEMIAVGDGENDIAMLEYAGLGVAMANAAESVRSRCDRITASNTEDGVALVIERFCTGDGQRC